MVKISARPNQFLDISQNLANFRSTMGIQTLKSTQVAIVERGTSNLSQSSLYDDGSNLKSIWVMIIEGTDHPTSRENAQSCEIEVNKLQIINPIGHCILVLNSGHPSVDHYLELGS